MVNLLESCVNKPQYLNNERNLNLVRSTVELPAEVAPGRIRRSNGAALVEDEANLAYSHDEWESLSQHFGTAMHLDGLRTLFIAPRKK